jgi:thymidylate synthase
MVSFSCIVAFSKNRGIGANNVLPWRLDVDLLKFKQITSNKIVIMGYSTYLSIPKTPLPNRLNIVITTKNDLDNQSNLIFTNLLDVYSVIDQYIDQYSSEVMIIGGQSIYEHFIDLCDKIYVTYIDKKYECDRTFPNITSKFKLDEYDTPTFVETENCYIQNLIFTNNTNTNQNLHDKEYINLCKRVLNDNIDIRSDRTGTGTISTFGERIEFDISEYIPVLTTKRIPWKSCIEELLWFMKGQTDANILKSKGVNIWNGNSSKEAQQKVGLNHLKEGDCGANYSFQWRYSGQKYLTCDTEYIKETEYDQINNIIKLLKTDPTSRRIFLSSWNPCDLNKTVLPPCHVSAQFYVSNNELSCHMYQRSCDVFLGLPWNILSYSVLTYILSNICGLTPKRLIISFGDTHVYKNHIEQVLTQIAREPLTQPILKLSDNISKKDIEDITIDDFELYGYYPHPSIYAPMSV